MNLARYFTELESTFNLNLKFWVTDYLSHLKMEVCFNLDHDNRSALCACLQYAVTLLQQQKCTLADAGAYLLQSPADQAQQQQLQQWLDLEWKTQQNPGHKLRLPANHTLGQALSTLNESDVAAYCPPAIYLFLATLYQIKGETEHSPDQHPDF